MLRNGTPAPNFTLRDDQNNETTLKEACRGKIVVLHFFRGAFCPTSHRDLLSLNDALERFQMLQGEVIGISADSPSQLHGLRRQLGLRFPLLSDSDYEIAPQYGVYESEDGEGPPRHAEPALFIIDAEGNIAWSQIQSGPKGVAGIGEVLMILLMMAANNGTY